MSMRGLHSTSSRVRRGVCGLVVAALAGLTLGCQEEIQAGPTQADLAAERTRLAARTRAVNRESDAAPRPERVARAAPDAFVYRPEGRRDPFQSMLFELEAAQESRSRAPLEQFELGQIALMGVIWEADEPRALVTDPEGRSFVVRTGSRIGKNEGRVVHIGDNLVLVEETYLNFAGEVTTKDVPLRIRRSQGG
jgi:type IV pilus assembly protein PilP